VDNQRYSRTSDLLYPFITAVLAASCAIYAFQQGQSTEITISAVSEEAGPEGILFIPPDF